MLITGIIWLVAAFFAVYNAAVKDLGGIWWLIAVIFAANGIRWIVKYIKQKKQTEEE